ncbi:MAG: hypothetical protein ACXWMC_11155, partial [Syntrophales bacterium]
GERQDRDFSASFIYVLLLWIFFFRVGTGAYPAEAVDIVYRNDLSPIVDVTSYICYVIIIIKRIR